MALISCKGLSFAYGGETVLRGVSFGVNAGGYLCEMCIRDRFNRDRAYESRRRPLETACGSCYVQQTSERYGWLDEVSDPRLAERLQRLSERDIELLTLLIYDGLSQTEAADIMGCKQYDISRQFARILKNLSETA